jgi:DNA-binding response OmpR family regulator
MINALVARKRHSDSTIKPSVKLLLIEDSKRLSLTLARGLRKAGYSVDFSGDGREGLWLAESNDYDVIILDLMLPALDGLTLLERLRRTRNTHVLILTAKDTVADRVAGLQKGADDYLVKPFAFEELLARVQALCRRAYGRKTPLLAIGLLRIDLAKKQAYCEGRLLELSPREFMLLEYLALRQGELVSRVEIETHIYDERAEPMSNVVDSAICILRRKIGCPLIHTRRGAGYILDALAQNEIAAS